MPKKQDHVHKIKRQKFKSGNATFFCCLPDCYFKISIPLALGKRFVCWRCGESFLLDEYSIRLAKPHCSNCHKSKALPNLAVDGTLMSNAPVIITMHDDIDPEGGFKTSNEQIEQLSLAERLSRTITARQTEDEDEL